jgi:hypothetical protein
MTGEKLHAYDLQLCEYVLGNIRQYLGEMRFARAARLQLSHQMLKHLVDDLDPVLDQERLLLNDAEFYSLKATFEGDVPELDREWVAYASLHGRRVQCVREIRGELTKQDAEDWSRACAGFAERLEGPRVRLGEGIEIVHEWVRHLRRLLQAMGATDLLPYPEGQSPTPTNPAPPPTTLPANTPAMEPIDQVGEDMNTMRELIAKHKYKESAPAKWLIQNAGIRQTRARDALRRLEKLGEYSGYTRKRPRRYRKFPPDQE